ncbi:hypothetical protein [Planktotalea sp.]|uniref:hypothetical protein n=1 Tax=Planktotalea sp. TaxID=2029877 RepID=UPI00329906B2
MRSLLICLSLVAAPLFAQDAEPEITPQEPAMTAARLGAILLTVDPEAVQRGIAIELTISDVPIMVIVDEQADRMRAMVPIRSAEGIEPEELQRMMQANFDTALDARYAVAQGRVWGTYIHPLSPLEHEQLLSGLIQTVNLARSYGQTYSGGALHFGGGDSNEIFRDLLSELLKKGEAL